MPAKIQTLEEAFVEEIKDLYDAEKQLMKSLPKMAKAAHSEELRAAFKEHLEVTREQVSRLEQVFEMLDQRAKSKPCKGMKGLIEEGQELIEESGKKSPAIADLDLIAAAQKVEHYEIAGYGTMRTFAQQMGNREVAQLLDQTLKEEEQTDKQLTAIAKSLYKDAMKSQGEGMDGGGRSRSAGRGAASSRRRGSEATDEDMMIEEEEE